MTTDLPFLLPPIATRPTDYNPALWSNGRKFAVQPKYNGVRAMLHKSGRVFSKSNKEFRGLHGWCAGFNLAEVEWLDGEIISMDPAITLQTIAGLVNSFEPDPEQLNTLRIVVFDCVHNAGQFERLAMLDFLWPALSTNIRCADVWTLNRDQADQIFAGLDPSQEGFIYRADNNLPYPQGATNLVQKRKRMHTAEYQCMSVHEGKGKFKGMFGGAVLQMPDGTKFKCGGGHLSNADRRALWLRPPLGELVTVEFPYRSDTGVPLQAQWVSVRNYE
jgi:ATP-dependent DNA ligase